MADKNEQADEVDEVIFLKVVRVGIEIYQEVQRKLFSSDCVTAELLRNLVCIDISETVPLGTRQNNHIF
jgi:hypothetical protein